MRTKNSTSPRRSSCTTESTRPFDVRRVRARPSCTATRGTRAPTGPPRPADRPPPPVGGHDRALPPSTDVDHLDDADPLLGPHAAGPGSRPARSATTRSLRGHVGLHRQRRCPSPRRTPRPASWTSRSARRRHPLGPSPPCPWAARPGPDRGGRRPGPSAARRLFVAGARRRGVVVRAHDRGHHEQDRGQDDDSAEEHRLSCWHVGRLSKPSTAA